MSLFNSEQFGKDLRCWIGQIVDDSEWKENRLGEKYSDPSDIPGWGYRYKVRIFGKHPETGLRDVELPWADIIYPVTGGSGHASSFQTPNLRKNSFVFGIYLDGIDETQPCILGCFGNNNETNLLFSRPPKGFVPASGLYREEVPVHSVPVSQGPPIESVALGENVESESDKQEEKDGFQESTLPTLEKCAKSLDKTQTEIKKFIQRVEETQRRAQNWSYWVNAKGTELASGVFRTENIDIDIQRSSQFIAGELKEIINGIRQFVTEKLDDAISNTYYLFFPEDEKNVEKAHNKAIDLITCLFNKIIANLIKMIGDLLRNIVNRFINVPICAVENILSNLLGQLLGLITGTLSSIFGGLTSIIGSAIDIAGDILGFVSQILGFFLCDEQSACPENVKWSSWGGPSSGISLDFNSIFNKVKGIADSSRQIIDPNSFDFNLDFSGVFSNSCNVGPIFLGPPTVEFFGGGGRGARGNAVVGRNGKILAVDLVSSGSGYSNPPFVKFKDESGIGKGAKARARIVDGRVSEIIIDNPGSGYKTTFDGSRGGDGRVYANPNQIIVKRKDGRYDLPYNPGDPFEVLPGDEVSGPFISGPGGTLVPGVPGPGEFPITGGVSDINNILSDAGKYPVILQLIGVEIQSPGVNYSINDTITLNPSSGSIVEPVFGPFGTIVDLNIIDGGEGFTEFPEIIINTQSGYNAKLIPILGVKRINDVPEEIYSISASDADKVIQVIDCVGKI